MRPDGDRVARALADAVPESYWLDRPDAPASLAALDGRTTADLAVVGAGFTGLWTALMAKERDPGRDVVVLDAVRSGWAASGRNGGFCSASLTHGLANGIERFGDEIDTLEKLGQRNLDDIETTIGRYGIDCDFDAPANSASRPPSGRSKGCARGTSRLDDSAMTLCSSAATRCGPRSPRRRTWVVWEP